MVLAVNHLTKKFNQQTVVNDVSFTLLPRNCTALLGPNGAGKTTILRMLAGLIPLDEGEITFRTQNNQDPRQLIGYLPQYPTFYPWMTGKEFLVYCARLSRMNKRDATLRAGQLLDQVGLKQVNNKTIGAYSGGMKQRLGFAQALIHRPELLILDEPVSALDPIGRREIFNLMNELKQEMAILFSTHILNDADELSDSLIVLKDGVVVEKGTMEELQKKYATAKMELSFAASSDQINEITAHLKQITTVISVEMMKNNLHLFVTDITAARQEIMELIANQKWAVTQFQIGRVSLEEMFMKVVEK